MTRLARLKQEARETATLLGHNMGRFGPMVITTGSHSQGERPAAVAACRLCGALVVVDQAPVKGEPEISGEGVLVKCTGIQQEGHEFA